MLFRSVEDSELIEYVLENNIGLTCCPVSNSFVTSDMKGKEIKDLLRKGVKVTINSDDPAYFQSYISDDMFALSKHVGLTQEDVVLLAKNAFDVAWIDEAQRKQYKQEVDNYVTGYKQ